MQRLAFIGGSFAVALCTRSLYNKTDRYTVEQVRQHKTEKDGIWVTYKGNVYDITKFVGAHPGGSRIMLAAGGDIEPYWQVYNIHQKQSVKDILEQYRIGQLEAAAVADQISIEDPFSGDPSRSPILSVLSLKPFNAETPLDLLRYAIITPNEIFYKRNHLPVPKYTDPENEVVQIGSKALTLRELRQKYKSKTITATIQCAGNRRNDMLAAGQLNGILWKGGAIGNAEWSGVLLRDVILDSYQQSSEDLQKEFHHVWFEGKDGYSASIPIEKALSDVGDTLLAYKMNKQPLLPDHGFPLRVLVPGTVAARSVKWVNKISLSKEESPSHWQQKDYKGFNPSSNWDKLDYSKSVSIQEMPVTSAICSPLPGSLLDDDEDTVTVQGYAYSGGGRSIIRVDVSSDNGKTWTTADLARIDQPYNQAWSWTFWEAQVPLDKDSVLVSKAIDSSYNVQPDSFDGIYNKRGVLSNAWSKVKL